MLDLHQLSPDGLNQFGAYSNATIEKDLGNPPLTLTEIHDLLGELTQSACNSLEERLSSRYRLFYVAVPQKSLGWGQGLQAHKAVCMNGVYRVPACVMCRDEVWSVKTNLSRISRYRGLPAGQGRDKTR
jgi:hypothetical protein